MSQTPPDGDEPGSTDASDAAPLAPTTDYPSAPAPGEHDTTLPDLGDTGTDPQSPTDAAGPAQPAVARPSRRISIVVVSVISGVVLLAIAVLVVWLLVDGRDSSGPESTTSASIEPSADPSSEAPATGCTSDLCTEAETLVSDTHIGGDDVVWSLEGTWSDVADSPSDATGSGTAAYTSDQGEITLTVVGFADGDEAAAYADTLMADLGEPDSTRPVWDTPQEDRGTGEMNTFTVDGQRLLVWYDDAGVVSVLEGSASTDPETVGQFYFTMPAI